MLEETLKIFLIFGIQNQHRARISKCLVFQKYRKFWSDSLTKNLKKCSLTWLILQTTAEGKYTSDNGAVMVSTVVTTFEFMKSWKIEFAFFHFIFSRKPKCGFLAYHTSCDDTLKSEQTTGIALFWTYFCIRICVEANDLATSKQGLVYITI